MARSQQQTAGFGERKPNPQHLEKLVQRWRDKVYDCLVTNKRYEVIIRENVRAFTQERDALTSQLKEAQA